MGRESGYGSDWEDAVRRLGSEPEPPETVDEYRARQLRNEAARHWDEQPEWVPTRSAESRPRPPTFKELAIWFAITAAVIGIAGVVIGLVSWWLTH